jgi:hypothetical protein
MYADIFAAQRAAWDRACPAHGVTCTVTEVRRAWSSLEIVIEFACGRREYWRPDVLSRAV